MKHIYIGFLAFLLLLTASCSDEQFAENYANPAKIATTTVERQYTGMVQSAVDFIVPNYWNYFTNLTRTILPWTQTIGWIDVPGKYVPGSSGVDGVWGNYYAILAQYRELEKVYLATDAEAQDKNRVFKITADVFLHSETARMVDLFGSIPFSEAGRLSQNEGDYAASFAKFDNAEDIYEFMLDDLKSIAAEMNSISVSTAAASAFEAQDIINGGDVDLWKRFTNSLRLRLLTRVSASSKFSGRAATEIAEIMGNPTAFPLVDENSQNIMIDIFDLTTSINSGGFNGGINSGGWDGNDAGKKMIDLLNASADPRLRVLFEPGDSADGVFIGIDPLASAQDQEEIRRIGMTAQYNRTTMSNNEYVPGVIINAAEVSFLKAENLMKTGDDAGAKAAYEAGISQSTEFYYYLNSLSADRVSGEPEAYTDEELAAMLATDAVNWDGGTDKMTLIAHQKWIHFNILQAYQNWAELRRLDAPSLEFQPDPSSPQTLPPARWVIPGKERSFNPDNYQAVSAQDDLNNKLFWDVN